MKSKPTSITAPDYSENLPRGGGNPSASGTCVPGELGRAWERRPSGQETLSGWSHRTCPVLAARETSPRLGVVGPARSQGPREPGLILCRSVAISSPPLSPPCRCPPRSGILFFPLSLPTRSASSLGTSSHALPCCQVQPRRPGTQVLPKVETIAPLLQRNRRTTGQVSEISRT